MGDPNHIEVEAHLARLELRRTIDRNTLLAGLPIVPVLTYARVQVLGLGR